MVLLALASLASPAVSVRFPTWFAAAYIFFCFLIFSFMSCALFLQDITALVMASAINALPVVGRPLPTFACRRRLAVVYARPDTIALRARLHRHRYLVVASRTTARLEAAALVLPM
jgi:hypothetical protein